MPRLDISKITPKGLFARSLLIIVLPIALMQLVLTYLFFDIHWGQVSRTLSETTAGNIALVVSQYEANPSAENLARLKTIAQHDLRLSVDLRANGQLPSLLRRSTIAALDRVFNRALDGALDQSYWFDTTRYPDYVDVQVKVDGGVLRFLAYRDRVFASTGGIFLMWVGGATFLLTLVAVLFIRNQVRPMERLSAAAEAFGRGEMVRLKPAGSREVRLAAQAFLQMRARIGRHLEQRTNLLAAVSHDLRTPLTRLRLQLAMMEPSQDRDDARQDVSEMEQMLDEYLAFARGQWAGDPEAIDMRHILEGLKENYARTGQNIAINAGTEPLILMGRPESLKRALSNLVNNALGFAKNVHITAFIQGPWLVVHVDDDGPGIPAEKRAEALKAFARLDGARNQNRKGVGLGLALVRDSARAHGGELYLDDAPIGGLRATLRLPVNESENIE